LKVASRSTARSTRRSSNSFRTAGHTRVSFGGGQSRGDGTGPIEGRARTPRLRSRRAGRPHLSVLRKKYSNVSPPHCFT
jgi:hypothetical protein